MSLATPIQIRNLQRKLYLKAKAEPAYRFYLLYDKIYREDILAHAYELVKANQGHRAWMAARSGESRRKGWGNGWLASGRNFARRRISHNQCDG
jgi:RNA-directed DNA polymerase